MPETLVKGSDGLYVKGSKPSQKQEVRLKNHDAVRAKVNGQPGSIIWIDQDCADRFFPDNGSEAVLVYELPEGTEFEFL